MQFFEPLTKRFDITAFGSLTSFHDRFAFPVVKLASPMDLPEFPYKMPILNRLCIDAHYLFGLEERLKGFDLVHTAETYYRYTQQALNAKKRGYVKKVIATVWETIAHNNEGILGRRHYKARSIWELDHIIAVTNRVKNALIEEGADANKITVIPPGIDTTRFTPRAPRSKIFTILFVGRLEQEKGVEDILEALPHLPTNVRMRFVGDGSLRQLIEGKGMSVDVVPYEHMPRVYHEADIFVAPSRTTRTWEEQYGMAILEAQASGLPIVTTRSGGIPENVGDAAVLVEPGDVRGLVAAITEFFNNPGKRRAYATRARRRAVTVHDARKVAGKIAQLYGRVLQ